MTLCCYASLRDSDAPFEWSPHGGVSKQKKVIAFIWLNINCNYPSPNVPGKEANISLDPGAERTPAEEKLNRYFITFMATYTELRLNYSRRRYVFLVNWWSWGSSLRWMYSWRALVYWLNNWLLPDDQKKCNVSSIWIYLCKYKCVLSVFALLLYFIL